MGAWKSSDGGSIHKIGSSHYAGEPTGTHEVVSAATNVRGVTIWTAHIWANAGIYRGEVRVGAATILSAVYQGAAEPPAAILPHPIFVPAGNAVSVVQHAGAPDFNLTYDIH